VDAACRAESVGGGGGAAEYFLKGEFGHDREAFEATTDGLREFRIKHEE